MSETMDVPSQAESSAQALLTKTKTKPKQKADLETSDLLMITASGIENLTEETALKLADELIEAEGFNDFRLGGVLSKIQSEGWFTGFESFRAMIETKYGIKYRKAMYLTQIYNDLVTNQIPWEKVSSLGWTKLKEISGVLTPENLDEWVAKALQLTVLQLQEAVKQYKMAGESGADSEEGDTITSTVSTLTFKLHADQKEVIRTALDKAKGESGTEFDTVAMTAICTAYLGGNIEIAQAEQTSITDIMKELGPKAVLEAFSVVYPDIDLEVNTPI